MKAALAEKLNCRFVPATPTIPGAIALIQLHGCQCVNALRALTGVADWPVGRLQLVRFGDIDEGLAARITDDVVQVMPHGGPRVVQRLLLCLRELGMLLESEAQPEAIYPESADRYEALMLAALARAASAMAIDPLLAQPAIWRDTRNLCEADHARSVMLNRLVTPPVVVLAGSPNVGKSTLSNVLLGRGMSISLDLPGTTRDYTVAQIDLAGLVVHWHDTPGFRETDDPIEARAIELARGLIARADLLIAMTDADQDWPVLSREPDLRICNKSDIAMRTDADLNLSAATGEGIAELVLLVRDTLVSPQSVADAHRRPWLFDDRLQERIEDAAGENVPGLLP